MGVIVLRKKDSVFPLVVTCPHCGALLRIGSPRDLRVVGIKTNAVVVDCPSCTNQVRLYEVDDPKEYSECEELRRKLLY